MFLTELFANKTKMVEPAKALPGRNEPLVFSPHHFVNGESIVGPHPDGMETIYFGMGCFWGAERLFWQTPGVHVTAAGYAGGYTKNPTYQETCTGLTGHTEVVKVVLDPSKIPLDAVLKLFWEEHDPTQGMRQGNDIGSVYRSAIYTTTEGQMAAAVTSKDAYQKALKSAGRTSKITTEIKPVDTFYFAEDYHQQYLAKNPGGYCALRGTGVACPGN